MAVRNYRDLVAWQRAMDLVVEIYGITKSFPRDEIFGLSSQLRRAAVSIPSNIAEGQGRGAGNDFSRYLRIAQGSLQEVQTQLVIAQRLGYMNERKAAETMQRADEVARLLRGLNKSVSQ